MGISQGDLSTPIRRPWLPAVTVLALFLLAYRDALQSLFRTWSGRDDYSHGFLIPLISLYFVWHERDKLSRVPVRPRIAPGLIVTIAAGTALLLGQLGGVVMVQQIAVLLAVPGLVLLLLGTKFLKALALPIAYLVFMVPPVFDPLIQKAHWPFQLFSAAAASQVMSLVNIPVFRHGTFLELPSTVLEVANECSGVRYLISITALGIPLAYFTQETWRRRGLLLLLGMLIGIIINPVRVTLIGVWAYQGGEVLHGPLHVFQGLFVSVAGFLLLFAVAWGLAKIPTPAPKGLRLEAPPTGPSADGDAVRGKPAWLVSLITLCVLGSLVLFYRPLPVPLQAPLASVPLRIGEWQGRDTGDGRKPFAIPNADHALNRVYTNAAGHAVRLQIAYFESQRQGKELVHYALDVLYAHAEKIILPAPVYDGVRINKVNLPSRTEELLVLYWYDLNGRIVADNYASKLFTSWDGLFRRRTNGAMVIVSSNVAQPADLNDLFQQDIEFVQKLLPLLKERFS